MIILCLCIVPFLIRILYAQKISWMATVQDAFLNFQLLALYWAYPDRYLFTVLAALTQTYLLLDAFLYKELSLRMQFSFYTYLKEGRSLLSSVKNLPWQRFLGYAVLIAAFNGALLFADPMIYRFSYTLLMLGLGTALASFILSSEESNAIVREEIRYLKALSAPHLPSIAGYPLWKWTGKYTSKKLFQIRIEPNEKPHLILIFMESFRQLETPCFNALAKEGIFFPNFYSNSIRSNRAIVSSLFGIPSELGRLTMFTDFRFGLRGLPHLLQEAGYQNSYFHNGDLNFESQRPFLKRHSFEHLVERKDLSAAFPNASYTSWGLHDEYLMPYAADWLEKQKQPTFLTLFTMSNHHPWEAPAHYEGPAFAHPYLQTLHYSDAVLGRFIQTLKEKDILKKSVIVILGDHGQSLREHPVASLYEESVHVPLLILGEGRLQSQVIEELGSHIDLLPTVMDILSLEGFTHSTGKSLMRREPNRKVFLHNIFGDRYLGLREDSFKYILNLRTDAEELYDLAQDPEELRNIAKSHPDVLANCRKQVLEHSRYFQAIYEQKKLTPFLPKNSPYKIEFSEELDDQSLIQRTMQQGCLTHLLLKGCVGITDRGLIEIAPHCGQLQALNLSDCLLISRFGVHAILKQAQNLSELYLRDVEPIDPSFLPADLDKLCDVSFDDAAMEVALRTCPKLSLLKIYADKLTDRGLDSIGSSCKFLRTLHIQKAFHLTDTGLSALIQAHPQLTHLLIEDAPHLTDSGLQELKTTCIKLLYCINCPQITDKCFEGLDLQFHALSNDAHQIVGSKFVESPLFRI